MLPMAYLCKHKFVCFIFSLKTNLYSINFIVKKITYEWTIGKMYVESIKIYIFQNMNALQ